MADKDDDFKGVSIIGVSATIAAGIGLIGWGIYEFFNGEEKEKKMKNAR